MNTENNKIIAEFLKLEKDNLGNYFIKDWGFETTENFKFDTDWNWLMGVVNKCLLICHNEMLNEWENSFADKFLTLSIESMYKECIAFIKWYNINSIS